MSQVPYSRLLSENFHDQEAEMKPSARRLGDVEVRRLSDLHEGSNDAIGNIPKENMQKLLVIYHFSGQHQWQRTMFKHCNETQEIAHCN